MQPLENEWPKELKEAHERAHQQTYAQIDIEAARRAAIENLPHNHVWRQRGPHAVCTSCHPEHSTWIGNDKNLKFNDQTNSYYLEKRVMRS